MSTERDQAIDELFHNIDTELMTEHLAGYMDGRNPDSPEPGANQTDAYKHSWRVGRAEINNTKILTYFESMQICHEIRGKKIDEALARFAVAYPRTS